MDKIVIGKVIKPQGIKGEIKVDILPQDKALASKLKEIYLNDKCYKVISVKNLFKYSFLFSTSTFASTVFKQGNIKFLSPLTT